jgi:1-acyl-sn-glycerol-3-phosphate acyltransferase
MNNVSFKKMSRICYETPSIEAMARVVIWEVGHHFRMNMDSWWFRILHRLAMLPARRFARIMHEFDQQVANQTLWEATRGILPHFTRSWQVVSSTSLPETGPLLAICNHPGAADSLAAMAVLQRPDVHFLVIKRPMLTVMPNVSRHMVYLEEDNPTRFTMIRKLIHILQRGESLLLFPRGSLEPDPGLYPGALESIQKWSDSLGLLLSRVPETRIQLVLIRDVVSPQAWRHPFARMASRSKTRHQIAMILQTAMQQVFTVWRNRIHIFLPPPISARELAPSLNPGEINRALKVCVRQEMARLIRKDLS